ncbi:MAG: InlB B-repeat-containing protein, partial [Solirubrobacterales bacterium]
MRELSRVVVIAAVVCVLGHAGLVKADEVPVISPIPEQWLVVGEAFTYDVEATGDPAPTFSLTSAPNGMTIDSDSGVITWTPSAAQMGSRGVRVKAANSVGSVELWFSVNVMAEAVEFSVLDPIPDQTFRANTGVWTYTLKATGSPTPQYALNSVPINMELNIVTGVLTWRPTALDVGEHTVVVSAGNILGDDVQTFTFTVLPALYTVQFSATAGGSVTKPGEGTFQYEYNEYVEVEETPDEGYLFVRWSGTGVDGANWELAMQPTQTICVTDNCTVVANFRATTGQMRTLSVSATSGGGVWKPGEGDFSYIDGTTVVLLAAHDPDWEFLNWTGSAVDAGKVANTSDGYTSVIVDGDYTLRANFVPTGSVVQYHLVVQVTAGGDTDPMGGDHLYYAGSVVPLHAYPMEGYEFSGWTGPAVDAGKVADPTSADTTLTMDADYTVTANFVVEGGTPIVRYTLTVSAGDGGSVTKPGEGAFQYNENAAISINALADSGYQFAGWTGTAVDAGKVANPASRSTSVTMSADYTLRANFELRTEPAVQRRLTITTTSGGEVSWPGTGIHLFDDGQEVTITAKANVAYEFVKWTGSAVDAGKVADPDSASTTVTMDGNYGLCANFAAADPSKVFVQVVTPNGGEHLASGSTVSIRWKTRGNIPGLSVELSTDGGSTWSQVVYCAGAGGGSHSWVVPAVDSDRCLIRISVTAYSSVFDSSDTPFSIHTGARNQIWYVDAAATGNGRGTSWANAIVCLQDALRGAVAGDRILMAEGLYW